MMWCCEETEENLNLNNSIKKPRKNKKCITCLTSCCIFWFILCIILISVLVFVGRHMLYNTVPPGYLKLITRPKSDENLNISKISENFYWRLPNDTRPIYYNLTLIPHLDKDYFDGEINITLKILNPKINLILHSKKHTIFSVDFINNNNDSKSLNLLSVTENLKYEILIITPREKIFPGNYTLIIKYRGVLHKKALGGFYKSTYKKNNETRTIATSKFEPTYARQAFPCFDEPNMKAKYKIRLVKPKLNNYIALSNYPVETIEPFDDNNEIVTFKETVSMSTYLTCFIVSDFIFSNTTFNNSGNETELRVYASPGNLEKTSYAGQVAKKVIEYYVEYFGIPYPLPKLDMVAIPDFVSGAMEHWGLVTYRETALLYTNKTHSSANKQRVASVIAHELAHSWFGNLVTMAWWNDLWLNEGFATYITNKGVNAAEPSFKMDSQFQIETLHAVLSLDATLASHPIVVSVTTPDEITSIFDSISYNKGASILRMLENTVGAENFRTGVTSYLNKYRFGNAITKNFLDEIQSAVDSSFNISEIIDTFTIQMGYPIVNVTYDESTKNYTLTQKRFLKNSNSVFEPVEPYNYKWSIPITYITDQGKSKGLILFPHNKEKITIQRPENASWLKFNYDQVGYYRINYEETQWKNLINIFNNLSVTDRTHLLEETFRIAEAGQLSYLIPLDLSKQLINETEYAPWSVAFSKLKNLATYLESSNQNETFKKYIRNIVSNAYNNLSWNEDSNDSHLKRLTRVVVLKLACGANHENCLSEAEKKFKTWISDTNQTLSQDLRGIVYQYGMVNANEETWDKLLNVYKTELDANEKLKLMNGLASVKNTDLLAKLLELAKDESLVRGQDYFILLGYISANPAGTELVWNFVKDNWEYLVKRFTLNDRYFGSMIITITSTFSTKEKLTEIEEFFSKYPEAGAGTSSRKRALENVKQNINWISKYKSTVENWIQNF